MSVEKKATMNQEHKTQNLQKGQVVIVAILLLLVVSLIALAVSTRSLTDIKISQTSEDSARAFAAAEAGVEEAVEKINTGSVPILTPAPIALPNNANAGSYIVTTQGGTQGAFLSPPQVASDLETVQIFLADSENPLTGNYTGTSICLLWGNEGTAPGASDTPAIEATLIYRNTSGASVTKRFALDPNGGRRGSNNFTAPAAGTCGLTSSEEENNLGVDRTFAFAHELTFAPLTSPATCSGVACVQLLRLRLLYNSTQAHYVGVRPLGGGVTLPAQGHKIESTGQSGEAIRKVEVFRSFPALPAIFDFALYNHTGALSK